MKRLMIIGLCAVIALAGCTQKADTVSPFSMPAATVPVEQTTVAVSTPTPAVSVATTTVTPVATPSPTPQPNPVIFAIEGKTIVRSQGGDKTVVYDVTEQYPDDWNCWLNNLAVQPEALYFTEGGQPQNGDFTESEYAIVRIGLDGGDRIVLRSDTVIGYLQIVPYGERVFFVQDGMDSAEIGWAWRDGSGADWLDFTDYAARYGVTSYYLDATLYMEGGMLYADILFFVDTDPDTPEEIVEHTVCIGTGLLIQHVSG